MTVTYTTTVIGHGKHAAIEIPDEVLVELGANRRAPLKITVNGHTYQSTATGVGGKCMVVFPQRNRLTSGADAGDVIEVTLELDSGHREVDMPAELTTALEVAGLSDAFDQLIYSRRKQLAIAVADAKAEATRQRRIAAALEAARGAREARG